MPVVTRGQVKDCEVVGEVKSGRKVKGQAVKVKGQVVTVKGQGALAPPSKASRAKAVKGKKRVPTPQPRNPNKTPKANPVTVSAPEAEADLDLAVPGPSSSPRMPRMTVPEKPIELERSGDSGKGTDGNLKVPANDPSKKKRIPNLFEEQDWERLAFQKKSKKSSEKPFQFSGFGRISEMRDFLNPEKARSDFFQVLEEYRLLWRMKQNVTESVDRKWDEDKGAKQSLKERVELWRKRKVLEEKEEEKATPDPKGGRRINGEVEVFDEEKFLEDILRF